MATTAAARQLGDRYQAQLSTLIRRLGDLAAERFRFHLMQANGDIEAAWARWVAEIEPQTTGAMTRAVALADGYLAAVSSVEVAATRPVGLDPAAYTAAALRGADPLALRRRPLVTVAGALKRGVPFEQAVEQGARRAASTVETDVQLAARQAASDAMDADERIVGYRRVLSGAENCGLCIAASTQRYRTGDLMPIHASCDCGVEPIYGTRDPGQVIDRDTLNTLIPESGGLPSRSELARMRVAEGDLPDLEIVDHGELGPTLTQRRQRTDPGPSRADLEAAGRKARSEVDDLIGSIEI